MGGSSSKTVKTKYEVRHTVEGQLITTNISKKGSIKKKNKNSVKIKEKKDHKKSKSVNSQMPKGANLSVIEEVSGTATETALTNCPVYRKKSACPSCEARDISLGKNRSRSGSEKSLRFSDFNKVLRKARLYDWELEPMNIPLDAVEPVPDDICYICEVYTGSHVRACRVCYRAYHDSCLAKIGQSLLDSSRQLIAADKWTCHQCVSLNHLLTQEEVKTILNELEDLDISKEHMTEASYLRYCKYCLQRNNAMLTAAEENQMVQRFRSVDQVKPGVISFTQFLNLETVRVLRQRCKDSLVHLLTTAELAEARRMFQKPDRGITGLSPKLSVNATSPVQQWYCEAAHLENSITFIDEPLDSTMTWPAFLRAIALDLISQRSNPRLSPASGPDDTEDATLTFSSCASLDVNEDQYSTCNSELEPQLVQPDLELSVTQGRQPETSLLAHDRLDQDGNRIAQQANIPAQADNSHRLRHLNGRPADSAASNSPKRESTSPASPTDDQITGESIAQQLPSHLSPRSLQLAASLQTGNQWADTDLKISAGTSRSSPYNDSPHILIPWEDVEKMSNRTEDSSGNTKPAYRKGDSSGNTKAAYRKSEVIPRQAVTRCGQSRAVSQSGCTYMQPSPCGHLTDNCVTGGHLTDNDEQWKC